MRTLQSKWKQDLRQSHLGWIPLWNIISLIASDFRYNPFLMLFNWRMRRTDLRTEKFRCCLPSSQTFGCRRLVRFWSVSDKKEFWYVIAHCHIVMVYPLDGYTIFLCGISIDTHLFLYRNLRCLTYFIRMKSKAYARFIRCQSNRTIIMKARKRPSNVYSNELSVVLCVWQRSYESTKCFISAPEVACEIPKFIYHVSGFERIDPNESNYGQMMIACKMFESSSAERLMKWKQRPHQKCECDQSHSLRKLKIVVVHCIWSPQPVHICEVHGSSWKGEHKNHNGRISALCFGLNDE